MKNINERKRERSGVRMYLCVCVCSICRLQQFDVFHNLLPYYIRVHRFLAFAKPKSRKKARKSKLNCFVWNYIMLLFLISDSHIGYLRRGLEITQNLKTKFYKAINNSIIVANNIIILISLVMFVTQT